MDISGWNYCQKHVQALKYEPGRTGITFQEAFGRLLSVIKSLRAEKIMIKWNKNEAELLSKFLGNITPAFRGHPPIQACPRLRVAKPGSHSEEVKAKVLHPLTRALKHVCGILCRQNQCNPHSADAEEKVDHCALVE